MLHQTRFALGTNVSKLMWSVDLYTDSVEGTVPVASLMKRGEVDIVRPSWILDCIQQTESDRGRPRMLLPLEPRHMFFTKEDSRDMVQSNVDEYGDSFTREVNLEELRNILEGMPKLEHPGDVQQFRYQLEDHHHELGELPGWMFEGTLIYADLLEPDDENGETAPKERHDEVDASQLRMKQACNTARFAGARFTEHFEDGDLTHVLVNDDRARVKVLRKAIST